MIYLNKTLALTYDEEGNWSLATDKDSCTFGKGFEELIYLIKSKYPRNRVVIWNYRLSEQIAWTNEEDYSHIEKHSLRSFTIKFAKVEERIIFKNLKEFYRINIKKIAEQKHISSTNELTITWLAAESERLRNKGYVSKIPTTAIGYVRRELNDLGLNEELYRLSLSITKETHDIITKCKSGGLCGIDDTKKDTPTYVNCYDFKSFYPWIMVSQLFPHYRYTLKNNVTKQDFIKYAETPLWIATIKFKYIVPKEGKTNWLKMFGLGEEYTITNLDFKIIMEDYCFKIDSIKEMILFNQPQLLPEKLRNYIIFKFKIKETYSKDTEEYEQAKIFLNAIYGLFCQDVVTYGKKENCWSAKQYPLVIGKFVAAYGRYYLWNIMHNSDPLHWDTDGFKTEDILDITEYNQMRKIEGVMLGQLIYENKCAEVTVFGNKQYMINGKLKLAGTDGELANEYFDKINEIPHCGSTIAADYTSQVRIVNNKIIRVPYTIGKDVFDDFLQRDN